MHAGPGSQKTNPSTGRQSIYGPCCPPSIGSDRGKCKLGFLLYGYNNTHHLRCVDQATGRRLPSVGGLPLGSFGHQHRSFLKEPCLVLGDVFPDVFNPNMIVYDFNTSQMNFIRNEHVKLDETCLDTQGNFKAHLSNIMYVLGRLTSKLHET